MQVPGLAALSDRGKDFTTHEHISRMTKTLFQWRFRTAIRIMMMARARELSPYAESILSGADGSGYPYKNKRTVDDANFAPTTDGRGAAGQAAAVQRVQR